MLGLRSPVPLLDADIAAQQPIEGKRRGLFLVVLMVALAIAGVTIGIFAWMPEQATKTVREVVEAAKSLIQTDSPPENPAKEEEFQQPGNSAKRKPHGHDSTPVVAPATTVGIEPVTARPTASPPRLLHNADVPHGTTRAKVRELLGEPELVVSKLEHGRVVEHLVYVNNSLHSAITVLLVDGRVSSVQSGTPTVGLSKAKAQR
jgi:hypothetical protein